jgi:hypothetical protein
MPTRQPASFNSPFSRIAASRAACLQLGAATREKALFIIGRWPPRSRCHIGMSAATLNVPICAQACTAHIATTPRVSVITSGGRRPA